MSEIKTFAPETVTINIAGTEYPVRELSLAEKVKVLEPIASGSSNFAQSLAFLQSVLKLSVPDFKDWDKVPESATRTAMSEVLKANDFGGFIANFMAAAESITPSQKP